MRTTLFVLILILICSSCKQDKLIIKNDTKLNLVIFYTESEPTLTNKWIYDYSKPTYIDERVEYQNIYDLRKPNDAIDFGPDMKHTFQMHNDYKLNILLLNYDSLISLLKFNEPDSTMLSRVLLGTITVNKVFFNKNKGIPISCNEVLKTFALQNDHQNIK